MNIRILWALLLALSGPAWAGLPAEQCEPDDEIISPLRYLRALSLDLRGELPSAREVEIVQDQGEVPIELIDAWLDSHAFATQAVRRHQALLWNNLKGTRLLGVPSALRETNGLHWVRSRAIRYRGINGPCVDEPAQFAPDGRILTQTVDGNDLEGYVEINPYWAPESTLKVCAFDAQTAQFSTGGTECRTTSGARDVGCGCGDDLQWCFMGASHQVVEVSMGEAVDKLLYTLIREDAPYTDLFESRRAFINGPLSFFYRKQTGVPRGFSFEPLPFDLNTMPELAFTDVDNWVEVELPAAHAGVLTRPAYLMRFQTNRARAARFYDAFLCSPFQPPDKGIMVGDDASALNPDLQDRAGCKYCHSLLEPSAAYWGRWTEKGFGYLSAEDFPPQREDCDICARTGQGCSTECRNFYITRPLSPQEEAFQGMLKAYTFRREDHVRNVEVGPRLLAFTAVADRYQRLPLCTAQRTGEWLLGRQMSRDDRAWLGKLAKDFVQTGYSYRSLVRAVVTDERYRRLR